MLYNFCVNALQRAIPISTEGAKYEQCCSYGSVNALQRAIPISTPLQIRRLIASLDEVSMPFNGQSPFLLAQAFGGRSSVFSCVNALQRAIPISTLRKEKQHGRCKNVCQCPSTGNPHFYVPDARRHKENSPGLCQCPSTGNPHFYACKSVRISYPTAVCQCPSTGNPHFYPFRGCDGCLCFSRVNALQRAIPISTVPSQNPHKQGVSEAISAGNSQNVLKQSVFRAFFWLALILPLICYKFITSLVHLQLPSDFF